MAEKTSAKKGNFAILTKLTVGEDLRVKGAKELTVGRFKHFFLTVSKNLSNLFTVNLLFFIFAIPALVLIFYYLPNEIKKEVSKLNMMGSLGIGYPGNSDVVKAFEIVYNKRIFVSYLMIPCFAFIGVGAAGLFMCARNFVWGVPFKIKQFFRGIKMHWWKFIIAFTYIGVLVFAIMFSTAYAKKQALLSKAVALPITMQVFAYLIAILSALFFVIFLPMLVSHKFKYFDNVKNSLILFIVMPLATIVPTVFMAVPLLLSLASMAKIVLYIFLISIGACVYALGMTELSHYLCESFIHPLVDGGQAILEKQIRQARNAKAKKADEIQTVKVKEVSQNQNKAKKPQQQNYVKQYKKKRKAKD